MDLRLRIALTVLAATVLTGLTALLTHPGSDSAGQKVGLTAAAWLVFAAAAWLVRAVPLRWAVPLILLGGLAIQLTAALAPPNSSDDLYRYVWDGRVQAAGIDPYSYVPSAPQLDALRDPALWPDHRTGWCVAPGTADPDDPGLLTPGCTLINRPTVHTIYPPVAEAYYLAVHVLSPPGSGYKTIQLAAVLVSLGVAIALMRVLKTLRRDVRTAALWAWCPLVAIEAANNAHVDVLSSFFTVCALGVLARARSRGATLRGGVLLGLAVATKFTPVLAVPGTLRRRPVLVVSTVLATFAATYLPHLIAVGPKVVGFLPGYLQEEGYDNGSRFALIGILVGGKAATAVAALVLAAVALAVYRTADPDRPWHAALILTGAALLVTTPLFPWYALPLVALVAIDGRVEWLAVAAADFLTTALIAAGWNGLTAQRTGYAVALLAVLTATAIRARAQARARSDSPLSPPSPPEPGGGPVLLPQPSTPLQETPAMPLVDVVLPCLDEAGALPYVLGRLPAGYRAIVVDNGSTDDSARIAADLGALVVAEPRRGFGAACHAGLLAATADVVCFCDCDGSLDPEQLPLVAGPVLAGTADLVLGRRRPTAAGAWPPHARIANLLLAARLRRTGIAVRDLGPMRAARRTALLDLAVADRRSGYPLETVLAAGRAGWRIAEADVGYAPRTGKSKVTGTVAGTVQAVRDMNRVWKQAAG